MSEQHVAQALCQLVGLGCDALLVFAELATAFLQRDRLVSAPFAMQLAHLLGQHADLVAQAVALVGELTLTAIEVERVVECRGVFHHDARWPS